MLVKFMNTDKNKPGLIWNCATCRETKLFKLTKLSNGHKEVEINKYKKYNYQNNNETSMNNNENTKKEIMADI